MDYTSRRNVLKAIAVGTVASAGVGSAPVAATTGGGNDLRALFSSGPLSGKEEVPPVETDAAGAAVFRFADHREGPYIHYALVVSNIENVTQAHIHLGDKGENGDVVAFLFGATDENGEYVAALEEGVTENGILAVGSISADDLVGPMEGEDLETLVKNMTGETYVNVHTEQNPAGEIRGQIEAVDEEEVELQECVKVKGTTDGLTVEEQVELKISGEMVHTMNDSSGDDDGTADQGSGDNDGDSGDDNSSGDDGTAYQGSCDA